jgi:predicted metal-binding protein
MDARAANYAIIVCTRCRDPLSGAALAETLIPKLQAASREGCFVVETVACMAGCERPLAVAFRAEGKASFLFGDIEPDRDADALTEFGAIYDSLLDGWCNEGRRPAALKGKTLARIPAAQPMAAP